jgi:radical SAM protein with 4Fe4S-binding SPASM domain
MRYQAASSGSAYTSLPMSIPDDLMPDCDCFYPNPQDTGDVVLPAFYSLEITPACNNRCPGCGNVFASHRQSTSPTMPPTSPLTIDQWERILASIAPYAQRLAITGGEPTLHPYFAPMMATLARYSIPFTLFTNGRWGNAAQTQRLIEQVQDSPSCLGLLISLHGADAASHDRFTGVAGSFAETVATIRHVTQAGLRVHTNTVLYRDNHQQIPAIVALSQSLGAAYAVFNRPVGTLPPTLDLPTPDILIAISQLEHLAQRGYNVKVGTCLPHCITNTPTTATPGCAAGTALCTIDPWGNVRPCNHAPQHAGNLLTDSLATLWQSGTMQTWRAKAALPESCQTCAVYTACRGGCRADAYLRQHRGDRLMACASPLTTAASSPE